MRALVVISTALLLGGCFPQLVKQAPDNSPAPNGAESTAATTPPPAKAPGTPAASASAATATAPGTDTASQPSQTTADVPAAQTQPDVPQQPQDLWARIRAGFKLSDRKYPGAQDDIDWFSRHQGYLDRVAERAEPYLRLVVRQVEARKMPTEIALLPIVESAYQPFAYSHGRAAGLWQFVPGTARRFGLKQTWWYDGRRDVIASTRAALDYLAYLRDRYDGDWLLALAAYNSGEGTVDAAIRKNKRRNKPTDFWSLDLPAETRGYVPRLLAIAAVVAHPDDYGIELTEIPDKTVLKPVNVGSQIDLALVADLANLSIKDVYRYNPAFNRWATDPDGPYRLLLPVDKVATFEEKLAELPPKRRVHWKRHRIKGGENLKVIAHHYHTTVDLLMQVNGLKSSMIRAGDSLIIPVARKRLASYSLSADQRRKHIQNRKRAGHRINYEVQNGDTLWDIARKYKVSVGSLASWNGMAPRDPLFPGKKLVIWLSHAPTTSEASNFNLRAFSHPQLAAMRQRIGYTVREGDSLARISQRFRVTVHDLRRWNSLQDAKYLQPGQRLTLYVDVTSQSGNI